MAHALSPTSSEILDAADSHVGPMAERVHASIMAARRSVSSEEVADALESGGVSAVVGLWDWRQAAVVKDDALDAAESAILAVMVAVAVDLDITNRRLMLQIRRLAGNMVSGLARSSEAAIRTMVARLLLDKVSRSDVVALIRQSVGLTEQSALALANYREGLLALSEGRTTSAAVLRRWSLSPETLDGSLTPRRIERLVGTYSDRLLRSRALAIAETETIRAANAGALGLWRQQEEQGLLGGVGVTARKRWRTAADERVCPVCAPLDGKTLALNLNFRGEGEFINIAMDHPPAHTRCRCVISLEIG